MASLLLNCCFLSTVAFRGQEFEIQPRVSLCIVYLCFVSHVFAHLSVLVKITFIKESSANVTLADIRKLLRYVNV